MSHARGVFGWWCRPVFATIIGTVWGGESIAPGGWLATTPEPPTVARAAYTITLLADRGDPRVHVECEFAGLPDDATFVLDDFGEWTHLDSYYLRDFRTTPANPMLQRIGQEGRWTLDHPAGDAGGGAWDRTLRVSYTIPCLEHGSRAFEAHGLLPWFVRGDGADIGSVAIQTTNTLLRVEGEPVDLERTLTIHVPEGMPIVTGWGGAANDGAAFPLSASQLDGGLVLVGPHRVARAVHLGQPVEVYQFTGSDELASEMLAFTRDMLARYGEATGRPLRDPMRVFVVNKGGGQLTPHGLFVQGATQEEWRTPEYRHLVAHELFHMWLGNYAKAGEGSLVWFSEGFTDYLSLLHLVGRGHAPREWFADRLLAIDDLARASPAYAATSFADAAINWRDGNGPMETLAYRGGAILAFHIDAELHRRGQPRLSRLIGALTGADGGVRDAPPFTLDSIHAWMEDHAAGDLFESSIVHSTRPDVLASLRAVGFELVPTDLAYLGIRLEGGKHTGGIGGTIAGIDPDGPAARADVCVGDVITGYWPCRADSPRIPLQPPDQGSQNVAVPERTGFAFGLTLADPASDTFHLGLSRGDQVIEGVAIRLRRLPRAGVIVRPAAASSVLDTFFETPP